MSPAPLPSRPSLLGFYTTLNNHYERLCDLCAFSAILPMAQMTDVSPVSENVAIFAKKLKEAFMFQPLLPVSGMMSPVPSLLDHFSWLLVRQTASTMKGCVTCALSLPSCPWPRWRMSPLSLGWRGPRRPPGWRTSSGRSAPWYRSPCARNKQSFSLLYNDISSQLSIF